jgi:hypothetical protein
VVVVVVVVVVSVSSRKKRDKETKTTTNKGECGRKYYRDSFFAQHTRSGKVRRERDTIIG